MGSSTTFSITVNPIPVLSPVANQIICEGANVPASSYTSSVSGTTFNWTNSNTTIGLAASGTGNITSFPIQNSTLMILNSTILVTPIVNGCSGAPINYTISAVPAPVIVTILNKNGCVGTSVSTINFTSIPAGSAYSWTNNNTNTGFAATGIGPINSFIATNADSTAEVSSITVTPTLNGCPGSTSTFTITIQPKARVAVPGDTIVCGREHLGATAFIGTPVASTFNWTNSNKAIGLANNGIGDVPSFAAINRSGTPVSGTITVTPSVQGCPGVASSYKITVNSIPIADFSYSPEDATVIYPTISFFDNSKFANTWYWDFGDGENSWSKNATHDYLDTGCYLASLLTYTSEGCRDSVLKNICIKNEFHLYIPNAFSPNGDGLNDSFIPVGMGLLANDYEMTIYNRKATLIFVSTQIEKGWDGKSNSLMLDDKSPMDTYVYKIRCKDMDGKFHFFTGQINLVR